MLKEEYVGIYKVRLLDYELESEEYEPFEEGMELECHKWRLYANTSDIGYYEYRYVLDENIFWMVNEVEELEKINPTVSDIEA